MIPSSRILITGGSGFVGLWLRDKLAHGPLAGATVRAVGGQGSDGAVVDITVPSAVDKLVQDFQPTAVLHLAAVSSLNEARLETRRTWDVNLFGTMNLAEAVMRHTPEARFIFAGSSEVYGASFNRAEGPLDEAALLNPRNTYAASKAAADLMLGQMAEAGLRAVRFRPFNHTGPGQSTRFVVPAFATQIAAIERGEREPVLKVGNLDARRDFLDVRDVVDAYILAILAPVLSNGAIFNLASGIPRRIGDVLDGLLARSRIAIRVERDETLMRPIDILVTAGDARQARDLLDWSPSISWDTTLDDVLDACRMRHV